MVEKMLSRSVRLMFVGGVVMSASLLAQQAVAQEVQRVEITGSSIKRLSAEAALPITTVKADDFVKQGLTTAQEVLATIPMNQTSQTSSQSVGSGTGGKSTANLRGLGGDKTLVLLNGRRLANHPYGGASIDLNVIPVSALDRVEVLRDGASAIYGTDAIGGVINFITKRSVQGLTISGELIAPEKTGGAEQRINLTGGFGNLNTDGYNFFGILDIHKQDRLASTDREFSKTGVIPSRGLNLTSGTPHPANFFSDKGITGNPGFATGCELPYSTPRASNKTCRFDYTQFVDNIPKTEQKSFLGKASFKLGEKNTASLEYLHSESTNEARVAPPPMALPGVGLIMPSTSPYYPGKSGGVPAVAGLTGEDLTVSWRPLESGQRQGFDNSKADRFLAGLEGEIAGWDYKTAVTYSKSTANSSFTGGYLKDSEIVKGIANGTLNPFGKQSAAGAAFLQASLLKGQYLDATMKSTGVDFTLSKELAQLSAGALGFAFGGEFRKDVADYKVDRAIASQASSSGYANSLDQSGDRTISAVFGEMNIPVIKNMEIQLAARYDKYSDVGGTFNPKIGIRYEPTKQVLFRGSYNTGFRAPTLYDLRAPQTTSFTSDSYNDPKLCPGGVPLPGVNPNVACDQQQMIQSGGNPNLKPEISKTGTIGMVFEPVESVTASIDLWKINLRDQISSLPEQSIFGDPVKYNNLFVYSADGKALKYIIGTQANLGEINTQGIDVSLTYRLPKTSFGNFVVTMDGTYVDKYEYQNEKDGEFTQNAGRYADSSPVQRWRHNLVFRWNQGAWGASLAERFSSGYEDQNQVADKYKQDVSSYSVWTLSGSYSGVKNLSITAGVKNLFNQDPPFSNQGTVFQKGYDPRYTDSVGRAYFVRAGYKFW